MLPGLHQARALRADALERPQTSVDNGAAGDSPGDEVNVTGTLNATVPRRGARRPRCPHRRRDELRADPYTFTATLPNGQITAIGVVQIQRNITGFRGAVVGGTLQYRNARGQVHVSFAPNGGAHFVYSLIP